jgi:hypothetical protein
VRRRSSHCPSGTWSSSLPSSAQNRSAHPRKAGNPARVDTAALAQAERQAYSCSLQDGVGAEAGCTSVCCCTKAQAGIRRVEDSQHTVPQTGMDTKTQTVPP